MAYSDLEIRHTELEVGGRAREIRRTELEVGGRAREIRHTELEVGGGPGRYGTLS